MANAPVSSIKLIADSTWCIVALSKIIIGVVSIVQQNHKIGLHSHRVS